MKDIVMLGLNKSFGEKRVLTNFSATLPAGAHTCLAAPSGAGKTTLANILLGLEKPDSGSISGLPPRVSAVFQEDRLAEDFTVLGNMRFAIGRVAARQSAPACLAALGLGSELYTPVRELSGGMKRRAAIARALLAPFELIILDEPFKGLDAGTRANVAAEINARTAGKTLLLISHSPEEAQLLGCDLFLTL